MVALTDPHELLEVFTAEGTATGRARARGLIHQQGDWHLAFFCWIVRSGPHGAELVFQKRSEWKDVFPGRFDASAAGHVRFGETRHEMVREVEEELGLRVTEGELLRLPQHRQQHSHPNGLIDREHYELNLWRCDLPLEAYRPNPAEVSGLISVAAVDLVQLVEGVRGQLATELVTHAADGSSIRSSVLLGRSDFVPYDDGYHQRLAEQAALLVAAERAAGR